MTSCAPLTEVALQTLRDAERGEFVRLAAAAMHELRRLRALSAGQRLAELDQLLLLAECVASVNAPVEPIGSRPMRL